jgi:glutamate racemase
MLIADASHSIGVFDSGLGGLTVLRALKQAFPHENYIYLGDTARLPYGTKSVETVSRYLDQTMDYLIQRKVKALVVACNTASAALMEFPRESHVPVYNVIEPGAQAALEVSSSLKIGVLATRGTVRGKAYLKALKALNPKVQAFQHAAPLLVPLVEEGWIEDPLTNLVLHRYLQPLLQQQIDTLILGCTHYPILKNAIQKICGSGVQLVDSGNSLSRRIFQDMKEQRLLPRGEKEEGFIDILTTDSGEHFRQQAENILTPFGFRSFEKTDL